MSWLAFLAVGIGLGVSALSLTAFGFSAGGMVVPGYLAMHLDTPLKVAMTLVAGLITQMIVKGLSEVIIIYGKREIAAAVLIGYLVGYATNELGQFLSPVGVAVDWTEIFALGADDGFAVIGRIIPGLIALQLIRQGPQVTFCGLLTGAVIVRLSLIVLVGTGL